MIKFNDILQEMRYIKSPANLKQVFINNCSDFYRDYVLKGIYPHLFRGISNVSSDAFVLKPTPSKPLRKSANTNNYYTLYMNNSPEWSGFPKREIICTNNEETAQSYGVTFIVIPFNGTKFGVCPKEDIWLSFNTFFFKKVNHLYQAIYDPIKLKDEISETNWNLFIKQTKSVTMDKSISLAYSVNGFMYAPVVDLMYNKKCKDLFELFSKLFSPKKFKIVNYNNIPESFYDKINVGSEHEVWLDSPCLLISQDLYPKFIEAVKKKIGSKIK